MRIKSITVRLFGVVAISAIGIVVLALCAANSMKQSMVADSIAKTNSLAEVARSIAQSFDDRAKKGEFDTKTAQEMAKATIRTLRYDGKEYFFAYDYNGTNTCQTCAPIISTTSWTSADEGTACAVSGGDYCHNSGTGSTCQYGCFISGSYYASGAVNASNPCQVCTPATSTTAWSDRATGISCATGKVCNGSTCSSGCFISGTYYANNTLNPGNSCQKCVAATSTTSWTTLADNTSCNSIGVCTSGSCVTCPLCGGQRCCSPKSCGGSPLSCE